MQRIFASVNKRWLVGMAISSLGGLIAVGAKHAEFQASVPQSSTSPSAMADPSKGHTMDHSGSSMNHGMDLGPADAALDLRFIDAMIPHHQGATLMAKAVLKQSQRPEMKALAQAIINAQTTEINQMQQWRKAWYPQASDTPMAWHAAMGHMMAMSPEQRQAMMMSQSLGATDAGFDLRFIDAMIPHHQGAIAMAQEVLSKSQRPEIKTLAKAILSDQQAEIRQMEQWRRKWYGQ